MLMYHNTQINTTRPNFSSISQNKPKERDYNVIYRTQDHIDELERLGWKHLRSRTTKKNKTAFALLKILSWDLLNKGHCHTTQGSLGGLVARYGYDKAVQERQVRRALNKLRDAGFITFRLKNPRQEKSVNSYQVTELGFDMYHYFIQENKWLTQIQALELSTGQVINSSLEQKMTGAFQKNDRYPPESNPNDSGTSTSQKQKNDRYLNIPYINKYINITRARDPHIFSFNPYPEPKPEVRDMTQHSQAIQLTAEQKQVVEEILCAVDAKPGDEAVFKDELQIALDDHRRRGIHVKDFRYFANAVREHTWKKYYWDVRDARSPTH